MWNSRIIFEEYMSEIKQSICTCACTHTMVFPTCLKAFSTNSLTLCTSPVAMTKSCGFSCCSISHIAWKRQRDKDREFKPLRDQKDSSALHNGSGLTWSWQTGSEPATSERGICPYLCPDVTAVAHGTNTVGKEDRALPQAHCAAGKHKLHTWSWIQMYLCMQTDLYRTEMMPA